MSDSQRLRTAGGPIQTVERLTDEIRPLVFQYVPDPALAGLFLALIRRMFANAALEGYQAGRASREKKEP